MGLPASLHVRIPFIDRSSWGNTINRAMRQLSVYSLLSIMETHEDKNRKRRTKWDYWLFGCLKSPIYVTTVMNIYKKSGTTNLSDMMMKFELSRISVG